MTTKLKNKIKSIKPTFSDNGALIYSLPQSVTLHLDTKEYLIELTLNGSLLETNIYLGEDKYHLDNDDVNFIYDYLNGLLEHQIELTKRYYQEELYNSMQ
jgi:hypothetical protein